MVDPRIREYLTPDVIRGCNALGYIVHVTHKIDGHSVEIGAPVDESDLCEIRERLTYLEEAISRFGEVVKF